MLQLEDVQVGPVSIVARCALDDLRFHCTVWYADVDLRAIPDIERLAVHIALFQLNAVASLRPDAISLGPYARYLTPELVTLWSIVFGKVWAQWRWEHEIPAYIPRFIDPLQTRPPAISAGAGPVELLAFSGGGKDSLVMAKLLERAGLPFATLGYSHSVYGPAAPQHALLDRLGPVTARVRAEKQWVIDDILDSPVPLIMPELGARSIHAAETPASVFAAIPLALARGYRGLVVGHEASANRGNFTWGKTGEVVNHQWGKSWEAERLLDEYIGSLVQDLRYFSLLQPIHDEVIFELLARDAALASLTHSCNVAKPWCGRCAKCAYVWLQMAAHLPRDVVAATFGDPTAIGERPENERWFAQLLGLADHSPFECVGSVPEARVALLAARSRGYDGPRLRAYADAIGPFELAWHAEPLVQVGQEHGMPAHVAAKVMPLLTEAAAAARRRLGL